MKTKLRRFVSILSAMVSMILCAFPAFADDTVTKNDLSSVKWNIVSKSSDIPHPRKQNITVTDKICHCR